jgi:hypothetical protein
MLDVGSAVAVVDNPRRELEMYRAQLACLPEWLDGLDVPTP